MPYVKISVEIHIDMMFFDIESLWRSRMIFVLVWQVVLRQAHP